MATRGKSANVVWELSDEGRVVVDVDSPLRPFGSTPTPAHGVPALPSSGGAKKDETEPEGEAVDDNDTPVKPTVLPKNPEAVRLSLAAAGVALAASSVSFASAADRSSIPVQFPDVLRAMPKGQKPFLHAVITQSDVAALSPHDEELARETATGEGDDGYLRSIYLAAAMIEASQLGAATVVVGDPLLRTQTLLDQNKKPYTIMTTLEIDFVGRKGNRYQHLFFADEKPPAGMCDEGVVVVTSEEVLQKGARWPSRVELIAAIAKKTSPDRYVTDLRFEPAERGGRKLRGVIRSSDAAACALAAAPKSVKLTRRKDHHFYAAVVVNGLKIGDALVDTGATSLAISQKLASAAGVIAAANLTVETASGSVEAKKGVADVVTIAGMPVRSVDVAMLPSDGGDPLIGMSVLEAFDIAVSGDTMTLTAR